MITHNKINMQKTCIISIYSYIYIGKLLINVSLSNESSFYVFNIHMLCGSLESLQHARSLDHENIDIGNLYNIPSNTLLP